jgi:hypothetical protein
MPLLSGLLGGGAVGGGTGAVDSVTGNIVNNGDPTNPIVTQIQPDWSASTSLAQILNKPTNLITGAGSVINRSIAIYNGTSGQVIQGQSYVTINSSGELLNSIPDGGNAQGLRVTQDDITNNPRAVTIVQNADNYALKIDHTGDYDGVNITSTTTGSFSPFSINAQNQSFSTVKVVNTANSTGGSVITAIGSGPTRQSDIFSAQQDGTGQAFKANMNGNGISFDAQSFATSAACFNANARNTSGNVIKLLNSVAQTLNELGLFWMSHASSTASVLKLANNGTGIGLFIDSYGSSGTALQINSAATNKNSITVNANNTSQQTVKFLNSAAQTANELLQIWMLNASSTAAATTIIQEGTGDMIKMSRGGVINSKITNVGAAFFSALNLTNAVSGKLLISDVSKNIVPLTAAAAISDVSGGVVVDSEARTAINSILSTLRSFNIINT